ncbi:YcaO-like family protein [Chelativorans salis]|uniref:YcaO-like family protein n=1 Tax=Chelativorans salis TaxID=2978478 RepID=A0ABT2LU31_9HYPH|nr:YcaO-like family protein [Chelativorans sp. EGI FJ00035]MCT7377881.1 YcaO-like family protein [Chelativorans sp. EGI FJ00035]
MKTDHSLERLRAELVAINAMPQSFSSAPSDMNELFSRLAPLRRRARITRLGDLTGLDRIGLPVVQAVRPDALSEVTAVGRGNSLAEAAVGAIMESLERFFSESITPERIFFATAEELGLPPSQFKNQVLPGFREKWRLARIPWMLALEITSGLPQPVPLELVHTRYTDPSPPGDGVFVRTTTGVACHTSVVAAFLHGLYECIERDAIARAFATHGFFERMRLETSFPFDSRTAQLLDRARSNGLSTALWYAPSPAKVPVVWCQTIETGTGEPILSLPTEGYSAGATLADAASNALLEALATRAVAISGAREDQVRQRYRTRTDVLVAQARQLIASDIPSACIEARDMAETGDVGMLVQTIAASRLGPVFVVRVGADVETGVQCIRTILAGAHPLAMIR